MDSLYREPSVRYLEVSIEVLQTLLKNKRVWMGASGSLVDRRAYDKAGNDCGQESLLEIPTAEAAGSNYIKSSSSGMIKEVLMLHQQMKKCPFSKRFGLTRSLSLSFRKYNLLTQGCSSHCGLSD